MWATFRQRKVRHAERSAINAAGFTLLEILVVVVIMSLIAGLALPRISSVYDSVRFALARDSAVEQLASLSHLGLSNGRPLRVESARDLRNLGIELQEDVKLEVLEPLLLSANGSCLGGQLRLSGRGRTVTIGLSVPFCRPELSDAPGQ